jgi:membrane protein implicated in regulation of membrane protease activity
MLADLIHQLGPWNWLIAGIILLGVEILAPGNVFVWFGLAALVTGAFAFLTDFGWQTEVLVFVVLAVVLALAGRRYFAPLSTPGEQPFLNQRAAKQVGTTHVLAEPIVDGRGRIRIDDTNWRVTGPDMPSGTKVRVVSADGALLTVAAERN